ncbi:MAG: hypothetical protein GXO39_05675 [Thermotogae bacterium]|nr:hypothetical protein [Thermotogota bacterium]
MSVGVYIILLALLLRFAGDRLPFALFRERIIVARVLPILIVLMLFWIYLLHSRFTLAGIYVIVQMFPEFLLLGTGVILYLALVLHRLWKSWKAADTLKKHLLADASPLDEDLFLHPSEELFALNVGFLKPIIVVSRGVMNLPKKERELVINHERIHAKRRDNLRLLLFQLLLPTSRDHEDMRAYLEIQNDRLLMRRYTPKDIARTLIKFSLAYPSSTGMATSLRRRLRFLVGEERLLDIGFLRFLVFLLLPVMWHLAYSGCYVDVCTK